MNYFLITSYLEKKYGLSKIAGFKWIHEHIVKCMHFFFQWRAFSLRLWPLLRPEVMTIILRGQTGSHRYPLWRDGQFYMHALPGIRTLYLWCSSRLPYLVSKSVIRLKAFIHFRVLPHEIIIRSRLSRITQPKYF